MINEYHSHVKTRLFQNHDNLRLFRTYEYILEYTLILIRAKTVLTYFYNEITKYILVYVCLISEHNFNLFISTLI